MNKINPKYSSYNQHRKLKLNRFLGPFIIVFIGLMLLVQQLALNVPDWLFSWNTILIAVGVLLGVKMRFRLWFWLIPLLLGIGRILADSFISPEYQNLILPIGLILLGCYIFFCVLLRKKNARYYKESIMGKKHNYSETPRINENSFIQIENSFGGIDRSFICKNLEGGYIKNIFGGIRINLMQANFEDIIEIYIENTFGGITFYVPKNWKVIANLDSHLSGIDDNSYFENQNEDSIKHLILSGRSIFGGIEIKSF